MHQKHVEMLELQESYGPLTSQVSWQMGKFRNRCKQGWA